MQNLILIHFARSTNAEIKGTTHLCCQRPVFPLGVSQHMHKTINLWKFGLMWSSNLQENIER